MVDSQGRPTMQQGRGVLLLHESWHGFVSCADPATGAILWRKELNGNFPSFARDSTGRMTPFQGWAASTRRPSVGASGGGTRRQPAERRWGSSSGRARSRSKTRLSELPARSSNTASTTSRCDPLAHPWRGTNCHERSSSPMAIAPSTPRSSGPTTWRHRASRPWSSGRSNATESGCVLSCDGTVNVHAPGSTRRRSSPPTTKRRSAPACNDSPRVDEILHRSQCEMKCRCATGSRLRDGWSIRA